MWGPPGASPAPQSPAKSEGAPPPAAPPRRGLPVAMIAGVGVVALVSALGLWGATQYVQIQRVSSTQAGEGGAAAPTATLLTRDPGSSGELGDPQSQVTVPWGSTDADDQQVGPMQLPSEWLSSTAPTTVPTVVVTAVPPTPVPLPTQPVAVPTPTKSAASGQKRRSTPKVTVTKTASPSKTPTRRPTQEQARARATPTPTRTTARPTPTPTKTTARPTPTPTRTTAPPAAPKTTAPVAKATNPYTPTQVCGSGFAVQRSSSFAGGVTYQLWNNSTGQNCAVTMKTADIGLSTHVSVTLEVQGGGSQSDSGSFEYYAGPVKLSAAGKCVRVSGSTSGGSTSTGWANCG